MVNDLSSIGDTYRLRLAHEWVKECGISSTQGATAMRYKNELQSSMESSVYLVNTATVESLVCLVTGRLLLEHIIRSFAHRQALSSITIVMYTSHDVLGVRLAEPHSNQHILHSEGVQMKWDSNTLFIIHNSIRHVDIDTLHTVNACTKRFLVHFGTPAQGVYYQKQLRGTSVRRPGFFLNPVTAGTTSFRCYGED